MAQFLLAEGMLNKILFGLFGFLLISGHLSAGNGVNSNKSNDNSLIDFYCSNQIEIDSCQPGKLYETIYQWMGAKYRSKTPSGRSLDCSGFATLVYKEAYQIQLKGGSYSIFPKTKALEKNELQPGDLVFFKIRKGRISHVGIYLGNNKFAHPATKGGVRIDDLNDAYYKRYFFKGGRLTS